MHELGGQGLSTMHTALKRSLSLVHCRLETNDGAEESGSGVLGGESLQQGCRSQGLIACLAGATVTVSLCARRFGSAVRPGVAKSTSARATAVGGALGILLSSPWICPGEWLGRVHGQQHRLKRMRQAYDRCSLQRPCLWPSFHLLRLSVAPGKVPTMSCSPPGPCPGAPLSEDAARRGLLRAVA
mmetsp:Transcript_113217/g.365840  ORF Transcript_113217/g.365840 Transcript_113217/m.365840 type:complete len:185 (+) Transcript_113217:892-1446(+)